MNNKELSIEELREQYEKFVFEMDDSLENLFNYVELLGDESLLPVDYSWVSLDKIENIYIKYLNNEIDFELSEDVFKTRLARYLGETLRKNMGGVWKFCENPKDYSYGFPELGEIGGMNTEYAYNPFNTIRIFKIRQKKGLIRKALESHTKYK